jgi:hypothetical protein
LVKRTFNVNDFDLPVGIGCKKNHDGLDCSWVWNRRRDWVGKIMCALKLFVAVSINSFPAMVSYIWDHSPHHFLVLGHISVNFGQKIKVDSVLETGECGASI